MKFLVTAGATREPIDPVRYLTNRSSGKMGCAIADAAVEAGHEVILIAGPATARCSDKVKVVSVSSSDEMYDAVHRFARSSDILVMAAAVADYKPATVANSKIKKANAPVTLTLMPTRDILSSLGADPVRAFLLVGFAAETEQLEENARKKLLGKNCDVIVANDANLAMDSDENEVLVLRRDQRVQRISRAPKRIIARELVKIFIDAREKCLTKKP